MEIFKGIFLHPAWCEKDCFNSLEILKLKVFISILSMVGVFIFVAGVQPISAQGSMTSRLIAGSELYDPGSGMHCALYNCPNGEQV